jgi:hypothetical protein
MHDFGEEEEEKYIIRKGCKNRKKLFFVSGVLASAVCGEIREKRFLAIRGEFPF